MNEKKIINILINIILREVSSNCALQTFYNENNLQHFFVLNFLLNSTIFLKDVNEEIGAASLERLNCRV